MPTNVVNVHLLKISGTHSPSKNSSQFILLPRYVSIFLTFSCPFPTSFSKHTKKSLFAEKLLHPRFWCLCYVETFFHDVIYGWIRMNIFTTFFVGILWAFRYIACTYRNIAITFFRGSKLLTEKLCSAFGIN